MSAEFRLDLSNISEEDLEAGSHIPEGRYHIQWSDAIRDGQPSQTSYVRLRYTVLAGTDPSAVGAVGEERLYETEKAMKRAGIFCRRLGLVDESAFGKVSSIDWAVIIGQEAVIEVKDEEFERRDGSKGVASRITFAGVWGVDDARTRDVPRGKPTTPKVTPRAKAQPKAVAADDFSDL
jgi:hypothetical protein